MKTVISKILTCALAVLPSASLFAQAPLSGQAGSDTTARAQSPAPVVSAKPTPSVAPKLDKPQASPKDSVKIGVIDKIVPVLSVNFPEADEAVAILESALCDGTEKTVGDLSAAMTEAKNRLVSYGYYLVNVQPARADAYNAAAKTLDVLISTGRFGEVTVKHAEGSREWYSDEQIARRFKHVEEGAPFNYNTLRQAFRSVNGHPDLTGNLDLSVRKAEKAGEDRYLDSVLTVEDSFPMHATVDFNNYAMKELDYWQANLSLQYLNLTGNDDVLTLNPGVTMNGDVWSVAGGYQRPFYFFFGGSWSLYGGYSSLDCDEIKPRLNLEGTGGFAGINSSWNLLDTPARTVAFNAGVQWRNIEDQWEIDNTSLEKRDIDIVPLTLGLSYSDKRRDWLGGLDFASVSETVNLDVDKDKMKSYSEDTDADYSVLRASWMRLQPLAGPKNDGDEWRCWALFSKIEGQYSQGNNLLTVERLAYGGHSCLRGYRSRGYLGDSGVYGTLEFRTPVFRDPITSLFRDSAGKEALERIQFFVFSDLGEIWYNEEYPGLDKEEFLWSGGFGARAAFTRYSSVNLDCAFPFVQGYADEEDRDFEFYLSVKLQY